MRTKECTARAITNEPLIIIKGPTESKHTHPPNQEECEAEVITQRIKRKAKEHPEQPPAQLIRDEIAGVSSDGVLSQLPDRELLRKMVRRTRRLNLPPNPKSLAELEELPQCYQQMLQGERFLLYDF